ncbi:MAG: type II toxin-antitoxin system VapC family toxin [Blastocatellia bacterium]|nr:type II toxin-antitoxin system VapC family toxin [Blastocatellia bacterium]
MLYLLDTNHCSYIMNASRKNPAYRKPHETSTLAKYQSVSATTDKVYMCEVSLSELFLGAEKSPHTANIYHRIATFRAVVPYLAVTTDCWELHGQVKWQIKKTGGNMEDFDLMIACVAKQYGCTLVTNDADFNNLPAGFVPVENWAI